MFTKSKSLSAALAAVFVSVAAASLATTPANAAAVHYKTAGVPQRCIVRPTVPPPAVGYYGGPVAMHHFPAQPHKQVQDPFASVLLG